VRLAPDFVKGYHRLALAAFHLAELHTCATACADGLSRDASHAGLKQMQSSLLARRDTVATHMVSLFGKQLWSNKAQKAVDTSAVMVQSIDTATATATAATAATGAATTAKNGLRRIAVYFSAHWCPPCRQFTPRLVTVCRWCECLVRRSSFICVLCPLRTQISRSMCTFTHYINNNNNDNLTINMRLYTHTTDNELRARDAGLRVIFASSDKSQSQYEEYMREEKMPWLAMPFGSAAKEALSRRHSVQGIPCL
jgi:hypothetical protein